MTPIVTVATMTAVMTVVPVVAGVPVPVVAGVPVPVVAGVPVPMVAGVPTVCLVYIVCGLDLVGGPIVGAWPTCPGRHPGPGCPGGVAPGHDPNNEHNDEQEYEHYHRVLLQPLTRQIW